MGNFKLCFILLQLVQIISSRDDDENKTAIASTQSTKYTNVQLHHGANQNHSQTQCLKVNSTDKRLLPPKMELLNEFRYPILSTESFVLLNKTVNQNQGADQNGVSVHVVCTAPYPFQVIQDENEKKVSSLPIDENEERKRQFQDFYNTSTYEFYSRVWLKFESVLSNQSFTCQSIQNPCLATTIFYSFVKETNQLNFSISTTKTAFTDGAIKELVEYSKNSGGRKPLEDNSHEDCKAYFYYEETTVEFPTYSFRCQFPDGTWGNVTQYNCWTSFAGCNNYFRNRLQPKKCWENYQTAKNETETECVDCPVLDAVDFKPFVATCSSGKSETSEGSFAVYEIPQAPPERPKIYFSYEDLPPSNMIYMDYFDPVQILDNVLTVKCTASYYYCSEPFIFALEFEDKKRVVFLNDTKTTHPSGSNWNETLNAVFQTQSIRLTREYLKLKRIYCFAGVQRSFDWVNASRPLSIIQNPEMPMIDLIEIPGQTPNNKTESKLIANETAPEILKMKKQPVKKVYELAEGAVNQTIVCAVSGNPIPLIQWKYNNQVLPALFEVKEGNKTRGRSVLDLGIIQASAGGLYTCEATSQLGTVSANVEVHVLEQQGFSGPAKTAIISASTIVALLLVGMSLVTFLWYRKYINEKEGWRFLKDEEVDNFFHGLSIQDPNSKDPLNSVYCLPFNNIYEIPRKQLRLDETSVLGSGQFGIVLKGFVIYEEDGEEKLVAVKTIKRDVDSSTFLTLLSEIKIMAYLEKHENIASLIATCTGNIKQKEAYAAVEFCENGDLRNFLQKNRGVFQNLYFIIAKNSRLNSSYVTNVVALDLEMNVDTGEKSRVFSTLDLLDFSHGIANGMDYLTTKNVIHGDLAARNILLTEKLEVKISDFGLSKQLLEYSNYYVKKTTDVPLPWKWLSIEAIKDMNFSIKSDVWSFGIVLFEIFSVGEIPYPGFVWGPEFLEKLCDGYRMNSPEFANAEIYKIMLDCWKKDPSERPSFLQLKQRIDNIRNNLLPFLPST